MHRAVEEQATSRKRNTLVQAVSYLRQRKMEDTVKALNNLVACNKVSCHHQLPLLCHSLWVFGVAERLSCVAVFLTLCEVVFSL